MLNRWFLRLALVAADRPGRTLAVALAVTLVAAPGLLRLELRTDGASLIPPGAPALRTDREIREQFDLRDPAVVLVESGHPDGIYNRATLERIRALTGRLAELDSVGPEHVVSLATEPRPSPEIGTGRFPGLLETLPEGPSELEALRADVDAIGLLEGTLVSAGGEAAAILVGIPRSGGGERRRLLARIQALAEETAEPPDRISVVGAPAAEALLGEHLLADLARLVPLALLVIAAVLWLGCRRWWGVALGLGEVGACQLWTFGLMGWLGVPVYLPTAVLPVILTTVGLADEIHLFWAHQRTLSRNRSDCGAQGRAGSARPSAGEAVAQTFRRMTRPILATSLTTAAGFLSFTVSPIEPVRAFGAFAACGVLYCLFWSLTAVPAALALLPEGSVARPEGRSSTGPADRSGETLVRLVAPLTKHRRATLAAILAATVLIGLGATRLHVQDSWVGGFSPESPFRRAAERADELLAGTHTLLVRLTFDPPAEEVPTVPAGSGPLLAPEAVRAVGAFEDFLEARPEVGAVIGLHSHVTTTNYLWSSRREDRRVVPDRPAWVYLDLRRMAQARGERRLREVIDPGFRSTLVTVLMPRANYQDTARVIEEIRRYETEHLAPAHAQVDLGGDVAVSQALIPAVVRTQLTSLGLALLGALVVISLLLRSPAAGLSALAPVAGAVVWVLGLMGWIGIPLGVATSMICGIVLGIGIDPAVHLVEGHRRRGAALDAVREVGPAIVADTVAIALGFGLLGFSQVPANRDLGLLVALALVAACLLTLVGLGTWLSRRGADTG